jgi:hypothetical protein
VWTIGGIKNIRGNRSTRSVILSTINPTWPHLRLCPLPKYGASCSSGNASDLCSQSSRGCANLESRPEPDWDFSWGFPLPSTNARITEWIRPRKIFSIYFSLMINQSMLCSLCYWFFFPLALQPTFEPWPTSMKLSVSLQFTSSGTFGRTRWTDDQLIARPLPVHKHRKPHIHKH